MNTFLSDVWSIGCILVEMDKGDPPWKEAAQRGEPSLVYTVNTKFLLFTCVLLKTLRNPHLFKLHRKGDVLIESGRLSCRHSAYGNKPTSFPFDEEPDFHRIA